MTLLQIRSNGQITLPASIRRQAQLNEGDTVEVHVDEDGTIHLVPKLILDRSQAYFWTQQWQTGEQEAQADIVAGRTTRFNGIEEAINFLNEPE